MSVGPNGKAKAKDETIHRVLSGTIMPWPLVRPGICVDVHSPLARVLGRIHFEQVVRMRWGTRLIVVPPPPVCGVAARLSEGTLADLAALDVLQERMKLTRETWIVGLGPEVLDPCEGLLEVELAALLARLTTSARWIDAYREGHAQTAEEQLARWGYDDKLRSLEAQIGRAFVAKLIGRDIGEGLA